MPLVHPAKDPFLMEAEVQLITNFGNEEAFVTTIPEIPVMVWVTKAMSSSTGISGSGKCKSMFCLYCCKTNHTQDRCFARIKDGAPVSKQVERPTFQKTLKTGKILMSLIMRVRESIPICLFFSKGLNDSSN